MVSPCNTSLRASWRSSLCDDLVAEYALSRLHWPDGPQEGVHEEYHLGPGTSREHRDGYRSHPDELCSGSLIHYHSPPMGALTEIQRVPFADPNVSVLIASAYFTFGSCPHPNLFIFPVDVFGNLAVLRRLTEVFRTCSQGTYHPTRLG